MAKDDGSPGGALSLGTLETTMALRLSPLITAFARAYPGVRLAVTTGTTNQLLLDVIECRLDGAFIAGPIEHQDIHQEALFTEELVLVTSPAIRSAKDLGKIQDLRTIVFRFGCSYRQRLESLLGRLGVVVARPLEFGSLDAIIGCVAAGVGITLLPKGVVFPACESGLVAIHPIPRDLGHVETLFVRRHDAYVSSAMTAFLDMARHIHK